MVAKKQHLLLIVGTAWMLDALDVALVSFIMPMIKTEWSLTSTQQGLASAITSVGMVFGGSLCGRLADKYGRKNMMMTTLLIFSLGNLALVFVPNLAWFMIVRFITGVGLGGELPIAATMLADNYTGTKRSQMLVLGDSFWAYGWIVASLIAYLVLPAFGWRPAAAIAGVFALYVLVLRRKLPKEQIKPTEHRATFHEVFSSKYRNRFIALTAMWFFIMLTYYGIFMWLPSVLTMRGFSFVNSLGYTLGMAVAQLPGYYLAAYLMKHVSRKKMLFCYILGTIAAAFVFAVATSPVVIIIAGAFLSFFDLGSWGILIALTPIQFPKSIRATAMGSAQAVGRVGSTVGPFLVGWFLDLKLGIPVIFGIFIALLIVAEVVLAAGVKDEEVVDEPEAGVAAADATGATA